MSYLPEFFPEKVLALEPLPVCTVRGKPGLCSVNGPYLLLGCFPSLTPP